MTADRYDAMGGDYAEDIEGNVFNASYERPAVQACLGEVAGRDVLDIGCGPGILTDWLVGQGASVVGFDVSHTMVDLARRRLGSRADLQVADLADGLPRFADGSFDVAVASLVLHYLKDWTQALSTVHRVLRSGGRFVASTHHPFADFLSTEDGYFERRLVAETWTKGGRPYVVEYWHRPLDELYNAFVAADFEVERLVEPRPVPELASEDPAWFDRLSSRPWFLVVEARKA